MTWALPGAWTHAVVAVIPGGVLAQAPPGDPSGGRGEEFGKTSPLALVVILLLGLATVLLIRSMNKRLRNVPASFDETDDGGGSGSTEPDSPDDHPATDDSDAGTIDQSTERTNQWGRADGPPRAGSP